MKRLILALLLTHAAIGGCGGWRRECHDELRIVWVGWIPVSWYYETVCEWYYDPIWLCELPEGASAEQ